MAARLDEKIGRPISITEDPSFRPAPVTSNVTRMGNSEAVSEEGTMLAGRIVISASVSVKFEIVD
jgi:uncharacterized protein YggE